MKDHYLLLIAKRIITHDGHLVMDQSSKDYQRKQSHITFLHIRLVIEESRLHTINHDHEAFSPASASSSFCKEVLNVR